MELKDLGYSSWLAEQREKLGKPEYNVARVTAVDRDRYLVRGEPGEVSAELAGRLMFSVTSSVDLPCVGDWVFVQYHNDDTMAIIHELLPRQSVLRRRTAGKKIQYQLIASNIDVAFIVQSCDLNFNLRRLERYLVMVSEGDIRSVVLLSKSDLVRPDDVEQMIADIRNAGIREAVVAFSNKTGIGLEQISGLLEKRKTYCLLGSSGVGKTTLLNHLLGQEVFETKTVRQKDGKGRHATARRQLTILDGGAMFIDNPGMRELGIMGVEGGIDESFADIRELSESCRFRDCTHTKEAGCSVLSAVKGGDLSKERYLSYMKLRKESDFYQMSYVEKRKKDRRFGRMVKAAMRLKRKK